MSEIVKGVLSGGMSLVAGWILPVALNLLLLELVLVPNLDSGPAKDLAAMNATGKAAVLLGAAVVGGLVLNMLQTPLYRILEGYLGWPQWAFDRRRQAHLDRRRRIGGRIKLIKTLQNELKATKPELHAEVRDRPQFKPLTRRDKRRTAPQRALLREELRRYPIDEQQILPTRLGNAIRRFEEYGWNRYRLDPQTLWSRLIAVVSDAVRKQVDNAQIGVDFFVCLLYGQLVVGGAGLAALTIHPEHWLPFGVLVAVPVILYQCGTAWP